MSEKITILTVLMGSVSVFAGYALGYYNGIKKVEIEKIKTERDMYEQRLIAWNKTQKNI